MSIKEYLENKENFKKQLIKLVATGLTVGTLATSMSGCDNRFPILGGDKDTTAEQQETVDIEKLAPEELKEVEQTIENAIAIDHDLRDKGIGAICASKAIFPGKCVATIMPTGDLPFNTDSIIFSISDDAFNKLLHLVSNIQFQKIDGIKKSFCTNDHIEIHFNKSTPNIDILNQCIKTIAPFVPEAFQVEGAPEISEENKNLMDSYLININDAYKNGIFCTTVSKITNPNKVVSYYLRIYPGKLQESGYLMIDTQNADCLTPITEDEYKKFEKYFTFENLTYKDILDSPAMGQTETYQLNISNTNADKLTNQLMHDIFETLNSHFQILDNAPSIE